MAKLTITKMKEMKAGKNPISWITAYDLPFAYTAEQAGIDMILVGDSGGMVQLGYPTTNPVTMDEMITLCQAARRGAPNTFIVGDMPQGSYEVSEPLAIENAMRFVKEAACDAIKLEGGRRVAGKVKAIADAGIVVVGHLGLTPQSATSFGGYRVQGKSLASFEETILDAIALEQAGASLLLLEAMPAEVAEQVSKTLSIPVLGIGAGGLLDGQLVIMHDIMGFYQPFRPWFAKSYIADVITEFHDYLTNLPDIRKIGREERKDGLLVLAQLAVKAYINDVKARKFPGVDYSYPIEKDDLAALKKSKYWIK